MTLKADIKNLKTETTKAEVLLALDTLGNTPNRVAKALTELQMFGDFSNTKCPIAKYLSSKGIDCEVGQDEATVIATGEKIELPKAVSEFIYGFITDKYDGLRTTTP